MSKTLVFSSYEQFLAREDKSINGVPDPKNLPSSDTGNVGCWNCVHCTDCVHCETCLSCVTCTNCTDCYDCLHSTACEDCSVLVRCNGLSRLDFFTDNRE